MAKQDIEKKIQDARVAVKSDTDITLLPLNTEEDMRRALRVVLTSLVDIYAIIEALQKSKSGTSVSSDATAEETQL